MLAALIGEAKLTFYGCRIHKKSQKMSDIYLGKKERFGRVEGNIQRADLI